MKNTESAPNFIKLTYLGCGKIEFDYCGNSYAINPKLKTDLPADSDLIKALIAQGLLVESNSLDKS